MKLIKVCKICKSNFLVYPCEFNKRKHCSRKCFVKSEIWVKRGKENNFWKKGRPQCLDCKKTIHWANKRCRKCYDKFYRGSRHHSYKGGLTSEVMTIRRSAKYKEWVRSIFERDGYTCQECGAKGGRLEADHIKRFSEYPKLRFELSNGRTLCKNCHRKSKTWGTTGMRIKKYEKI